MKTILAPNLLDIFLANIFLYDDNKIICFSFQEFPSIPTTKKGRQPNLCQLITYTGPMSTLLEPNRMILAILIDQLQ